MRMMLMVGALALLIGAGALAAEKIEAKDLHLTLDAPDGFVTAPEKPKDDDFLGEVRAFYLSPDAKNDGGLMLVHHMTTLPGGVDYDTFKRAFADELGKHLGSFKRVKQEDVKLGDATGFVLEFTSMGDGFKPTPDGTIRQHVRWFFLRDGDSKLTGILYGAREAAWNGIEPKFADSIKTFRSAD